MAARKGYVRLHTGLFEPLIRFGDQDEHMPLGEALITFIYSELNILLQSSSLSEAECDAIHPYFNQ